MPRGVASFPGLNNITSATITFSHGITPAIATVNITPQSLVIKDTGDLVFSYSSKRVTLKDCKIDRASIKRAGSRIISVKIMDRRWKWRFGEISGWYNERDKDGTIEKWSIKTPKELIKLCLEAMGEKDHVITNIPEKTKPEVKWENDNPAVMLDALCELLGCRVWIGQGNKTNVGPIGEGNDLPGGPIESDSEGLDSPEAPDEVKAVAGPTRFESLFLCEPVGLDTDGEVKPINELSYRPATGWGNVNPQDFDSVSSAKGKQLAFRTVHRWFRIKSNPQGELFFHNVNHGKGGIVKFIEDVLPLENNRVKKYDVRVAEGRSGQSMPAEAYAYVYNYSSADGGSSVNRSSSIDGGGGVGNFVVEGATGIVKFTDAQLYLPGSQKWSPQPDLVVLCAHPHREEDGTYERHFQDKTTGENHDTETMIVKRGDIQAEYITDWRIDNNNVPTSQNDVLKNSTDNLDEIDKELNGTIDAAIDSFKFAEQQTRTYADLMEIAPDGKIDQVTWIVGGAGCHTTISLNQEHTFGPKAKERRRRAREEHVAQQAVQVAGGILSDIGRAIGRGF